MQSVINLLHICESLKIATLLYTFSFRNGHWYCVELFFVLGFFFWRAEAAREDKTCDCERRDP
ncbi:Uncharacterized protein PFLU_2847 [Pseudomonas [fluorescens] SBW25]|uniref:Uncharacterized protein n=1 Tax=Pseudomonas fluorescens (strain SBW25) TaxID=216595 RepID=C3KA24_PSEFS|nr:Uncharacterized protein PFLU_2847 [Pseudomonas fluorescens SBW25]